MMLNDATLYQQFKQRIYMMLNYALIQVTGYLKQLALGVYSVNCPKQTHDKYLTTKCIPRCENYVSMM